MKLWDKNKKKRMNKDLDVELRDVSHQYKTSIPTLSYDIYVIELDRVVGQCEYRFEKNALDLKYYGHIGYNIYLPYRGANFSYKACLKMFAILFKEHNISEILITCNPDNYPSQKTINKLGGVYIETVDVDPNHELYAFGEVQKEIYTIDLNTYNYK